MPHSVELPFTIARVLHTQGCTQVAQVIGVREKMKEPINVQIYMLFLMTIWWNLAPLTKIENAWNTVTTKTK